MARQARNPVDIHVGLRIRTARLAAGMSQDRLGSALGVTFQQVQKYEKGVNRVGAGRLNDIARVLSVPVPYFFENLAGGDEAKRRNEGLAAITQALSTREGVRIARAGAHLPARIAAPARRSHRGDGRAGKPGRGGMSASRTGPDVR